jgi:hypothetical protein
LYWAAHGYIVIPGLFGSDVLDEVWDTYETAVRHGRISLPADPARDGHPGNLRVFGRKTAPGMR